MLERIAETCGTDLSTLIWEIDQARKDGHYLAAALREYVVAFLALSDGSRER